MDIKNYGTAKSADQNIHLYRRMASFPGTSVYNKSSNRQIPMRSSLCLPIFFLHLTIYRVSLAVYAHLFPVIYFIQHQLESHIGRPQHQRCHSNAKYPTNHTEVWFFLSAEDKTVYVCNSIETFDS